MESLSHEFIRYSFLDMEKKLLNTWFWHNSLCWQPSHRNIRSSRQHTRPTFCQRRPVSRHKMTSRLQPKKSLKNNVVAPPLKAIYALDTHRILMRFRLKHLDAHNSTRDQTHGRWHTRNSSSEFYISSQL